MTPGVEITLDIKLLQSQDASSSFTIPAKVVRVQENMFAAQFLDLDERQKAELYNCLAYEARRDIP